MAKPKCKIFIRANPTMRHNGIAIVYLPMELRERLKQIEGLSVSECDLFSESVTVFVDPRYDWDEVMEEIEALDTPAIPEAFLLGGDDVSQQTSGG